MQPWNNQVRLKLNRSARKEHSRCTAFTGCAGDCAVQVWQHLLTEDLGLNCASSLQMHWLPQHPCFSQLNVLNYWTLKTYEDFKIHSFFIPLFISQLFTTYPHNLNYFLSIFRNCSFKTSFSGNLHFYKTCCLNVVCQLIFKANHTSDLIFLQMQKSHS